MSHHQLDCRDLQCPMPIVRLSLAMKSLKSGETLTIQATDPAFEADLRAWSKMTGHTIERFDADGPYEARIQAA